MEEGAEDEEEPWERNLHALQDAAAELGLVRGGHLDVDPDEISEVSSDEDLSDTGGEPAGDVRVVPPAGDGLVGGPAHDEHDRAEPLHPPPVAEPLPLPLVPPPPEGPDLQQDHIPRAARRPNFDQIVHPTTNGALKLSQPVGADHKDEYAHTAAPIVN
jgi:hypothetical protein